MSLVFALNANPKIIIFLPDKDPKSFFAIEKDNDLAKPTNGDCVDGGTTPAVSTYPTAGNGFDFNMRKFRF